MCHENTEDPGQPHPDPNLNITLSPIATHGQDALATCGIKEIQQIKASKVQFLEHNTGHLLTTKQATDIFAAPSTGPDRPRPIPKSAILTEANLDITVAGVSDPIQVQLLPPNIIRISNPAKTHSSWPGSPKASSTLHPPWATSPLSSPWPSPRPPLLLSTTTTAIPMTTTATQNALTSPSTDH
jgi:hypothetical protein